MEQTKDKKSTQLFMQMYERTIHLLKYVSN